MSVSISITNSRIGGYIAIDFMAAEGYEFDSFVSITDCTIQALDNLYACLLLWGLSEVYITNNIIGDEIIEHEIGIVNYDNDVFAPSNNVFRNCITEIGSPDEW